MKKVILFIGLALLTCSAFASGVGVALPNSAAEGMPQSKGINRAVSMADGAHYTILDEGRVVSYSYATGNQKQVLATAEGLGIDKERITSYELSGDEKKVLFTIDSKPLYRHSAYSGYTIYDIAQKTSVQLSPSDSLRYAVFSPDGSKVAFVQNNNIFVKDMKTGAESRATSDGELNHIINGMPDWVYEEEWGLVNALRWSPDGTRIAYLRFDESKVKDYSIDFYGSDSSESDAGLAAPLYPRRFTYKYPVAGETNSTVSLHVYNLTDGKSSKVDTGAEIDQYVPFFGWTPAGDLYFYRINRKQNHLEVFLTDQRGEAPRKIYEEHSDKYIDNIGMHTITFLADSQRFIVRNETATGYSHLYMYSTKDGFLYPITAGEWEVRDVVYATDKAIWFLSNETSPLRNNLYVVGVDGKSKKRLTTQEGIYRITPSKGFKYYISYFSNSTTPNTVTLHAGNGKMIRMLDDSAVSKQLAVAEGFPVKEFFTFPVDCDGRTVELNCYILKPADFDPAKSYPVLFTQYSGPGSQQVLDRWSVDWEYDLAKKGYLVVCMDPRGTGGRGEWFKKLTYGQMGLLETEDQIAFAKHIATLSFVDPARLGIYGWSYGGFMSLNCILKGADVFSMAISVAPVTSWRYYDSVYTERVNGLPQENPQGYDLPSPIYYANQLNGRLLLIHGSADDNVHPHNSYKMAQELVKAGKQFDMMIYTDDNHSMLPSGFQHIREKMVTYCLENL